MSDVVLQRRADGCLECASIVRELLPGGARVCGTCGSWIERVRFSDTRARRSAPRSTSRPASNGSVHRFVADVLLLECAEERVERSAKGCSSSLYSVLEAARLGITGNGCKSTAHGGAVGVSPRAEHPDLFAPSAELYGRWARLPSEHRVTAHAVRSDGKGWALAPISSGKRVVEAKLEERIGLQLTNAEQRARWLAKIAEGDSRPALLGARRWGAECLRGAAQVWGA